MKFNVLYLEKLFPDTAIEQKILGPDVSVLVRDVETLDELDPLECDTVDGLMVFRHHITREDFLRFPQLRALVRIGVGVDRIDLHAARERGILVCNSPDYGTTEIADHSISMALALRRGLLLHHDTQRATPAAAWDAIDSPLIERVGGQTFGIVGLGRIGTAVAMRAKAFGCRVRFYDPYLPNGIELALAIERSRTLDGLVNGTDILSLHAPLTEETRNMIGAAELRRLSAGAIVVNTARGGLLDLDALESALRDGHLSGAGIDVLAAEPPPEPLHPLLRDYRARAAWLAGRLVVTPHVAYYSKWAWQDMRLKSVETMQAALAGSPQNVIVGDAGTGHGVTAI